ncbi:hypothetical protein JTB14_020180 [Gonioctena quinquepunctata]|nr:hypothetical protein JTB14_020180 [Gonioctena quinquepunctata]
MKKQIEGRICIVMESRVKKALQEKLIEVEKTFLDQEMFTSNTPEGINVCESPLNNDNTNNVGDEEIPELLLEMGTEMFDFEVLDDGQLMSISQNLHEINPEGNLVQLNDEATMCFNFNPADDIILESVVIDNEKTSTNDAEACAKESHVTINTINMNTEVICLKNNILDVSTSKSHKKKYYCSYCMKLVTNFGRHLMTVHASGEEVADISKLPKGHPERQGNIAMIRRQAQHQYNTNPEINSGTLIVRRRPAAMKNRNSNHYIACPSCKEMFSKLSLRSHVAKCASKEKGKKDTLVRSRQVQMQVHEMASSRLVKEILAYNKHDIVTEAIVYDEVCILYGNKLCRRYRDQRNNHMIRSRLREIGKFILQSKEIDETVENLRDIIQPQNYDTIVTAINNVAGFDEMTGTYKAPSTAYNLGLHIKEITSLIQTEAIEEGDNKKRDAARDLLDLINDGFKTDINKTVAENQSFFTNGRRY